MNRDAFESVRQPLGLHWVVDSGFGDRVAAMRPAEKGYRVAVIDHGREYADGDVPRSASDRFIWASAYVDTGHHVAKLLANPGANPALTITAPIEHGLLNIPYAGLER